MFGGKGGLRASIKAAGRGPLLAELPLTACCPGGPTGALLEIDPRFSGEETAKQIGRRQTTLSSKLAEPGRRRCW